MTYPSVVNELLRERNEQDERWGEQNHAPAVWVNILGEEFGELCQAVLEADLFDNGRRDEFSLADIREEAIQVAAVALAMVESLDRTHGRKVSS